MSTFLRTQYNYSSDEASRESGLACSQDDDMAQQQFAEECDINVLVKRFGLTGEFPATFKTPQYGDFSEVMDFQTALNAVIQAQNTFMSLPPEIRARFANDPQQLLEFLHDDNNRAEAERLGLVDKRATTSDTGTANPATTTKE